MADSILESFKIESNQLLRELQIVVDKLELPQSEFPSELLREFSQKIDRIMGTALLLAEMYPKHVGLKRIARLAELSKLIGYKAVEKMDIALLPIFAGFWADTLEVTESLLQAMDDAGKTTRISAEFSSVLQSRLEWLAQKVTPSKDKEDFDVDALVKMFGE